VLNKLFHSSKFELCSFGHTMNSKVSLSFRNWYISHTRFSLTYFYSFFYIVKIFHWLKVHLKLFNYSETLNGTKILTNPDSCSKMTPQENGRSLQFSSCMQQRDHYFTLSVGITKTWFRKITHPLSLEAAQWWKTV